jgi:hypothetical protein
MTTEVWIQPSMFPQFPTVLYAYEMETIGGRWWEVYDDSGYLTYYEPDEFPDFLDFARHINYDVHINTYESWEALDEYATV